MTYFGFLLRFLVIPILLLAFLAAASIASAQWWSA